MSCLADGQSFNSPGIDRLLGRAVVNTAVRMSSICACVRCVSRERGKMPRIFWFLNITVGAGVAEVVLALSCFLESGKSNDRQPVCPV